MDPKTKQIILDYVDRAFTWDEAAEAQIPEDLMVTMNGQKMTVNGVVRHLAHMFLRLAEDIGIDKKDLEQWGDSLW